MPSSDPVTIPKVLSLISLLKPKSILDVGAGNGKYGVLFREITDWNHGRLNKLSWFVDIDAVEIDETYITDVHRYVYNNIIIDNWLDAKVGDYDVIFMGDVLEHFSENDWVSALAKAKKRAQLIIVVSPNWEGSISQEIWFSHKHERHLIALSPELVGGRCLFANSKTFMSVFSSNETINSIISRKDVLL